MNGTAAKRAPEKPRGRFAAAVGSPESIEAWIKGFRPFVADAQRLVLPRMRKQGDVRNFQRVLHVCAYFHQKKRQLAAKGKGWRCKGVCHLCAVRLRFTGRARG
jgi:hypothetical protein